MTKKTYWYRDKNGNKWNIVDFTKEQAEAASKSLINCYNCTDCTNCEDCNSCDSCTKCRKSTNCYNCTNCRKCTNCYNCTNCTDCIDCTDCNSCHNDNKCTDCICCLNCQNCINCNTCAECYNCTNCCNCKDCTDCKNCFDCDDCKNCKDCHNCDNCKNCEDCNSCDGCDDYLHYSIYKKEQTEQIVILKRKEIIGLKWKELSTLQQAAFVKIANWKTIDYNENGFSDVDLEEMNLAIYGKKTQEKDEILDKFDEIFDDFYQDDEIFNDFFDDYDEFDYVDDNAEIRELFSDEENYEETVEVVVSVDDFDGQKLTKTLVTEYFATVAILIDKDNDKKCKDTQRMIKINNALKQK